MSAFDELIDGMSRGRAWELTGNSEKVKDLLTRVYDERCHRAQHHKAAYQHRVNLQSTADAASYAGWITAENPTSGPFQGTSFVWFPGDEGSVAVLVIGTDGFGADAHILGRPGHRRRLKALSRLHRGKTWVKPDLLDIVTEVPPSVAEQWKIPAALKSYSRVIYAATPVRSAADAERIADLLDLFFDEHGTPFTGHAKKRWEARTHDISGAIFPTVDEDAVLSLLRERRFVVLEGPPGTGKTRLARRIAEERIGSATQIQFHPARTYEDFVVGLFPRPAEGGLAFEVRPGDLLRANERAASREHVLVVDEINRADLGRVLGESILLFEVGEEKRRVRLPHVPDGYEGEFSLNPRLFVLATRNTADRSIARMDVAIRRRFAFVEVWPDMGVVEAEGVPFAAEAFNDVIQTFAEYADDETLRLVPGHAYFLDPRPDLPESDREKRVARRLELELLPLLRDYIDERMCGGATEAIAGLADRIESLLLEHG